MRFVHDGTLLRLWIPLAMSCFLLGCSQGNGSHRRAAESGEIPLSEPTVALIESLFEDPFRSDVQKALLTSVSENIKSIAIGIAE